MVERLPVIMDERGDSTVLRAFQRLLPNLQRADVDRGCSERNYSCLAAYLVADGDVFLHAMYVCGC